jgi:Arc/MetJ-type ribon-helix-helix transcriptional regulator
MQNIKQTISTKINDELMQKIDAEIQNLGFKSQSEFLRFSINNTLENIKNHAEIVELIDKKIDENNKFTIECMNHVIRFFKLIHQENLEIKKSISEISNVLVQLSNENEKTDVVGTVVGSDLPEANNDSIKDNTPACGNSEFLNLLKPQKDNTPVKEK